MIPSHFSYGQLTSPPPLPGYVLKEKMGFLAQEPIYAYPLAKQQALGSNTKTYSATHNLLPQVWANRTVGL